MSKYTIWQRSECPVTSVAQSFHDDAIKVFNERYQCDGCGTHHYAGLGHATIYTYLIGPGRVELRPLPATAADRARMLSEHGIGERSA